MADYNWWYYTLSAVAQTCGALVGVGGAFVIFKLDKLQGGTNNYRDRVIQSILVPLEGKDEVEYYDVSDEAINSSYKAHNEVGDIIDKQGNVVEKVKRVITERYGGQYNNEYLIHWIKGTVRTLSVNIEAEKASRFYFKQSLLLLISTIVLNIILLAFASPHSITSNVLFVLITLYSVCSIVYSTYLYWKILSKRIVSY